MKQTNILLDELIIDYDVTTWWKSLSRGPWPPTRKELGHYSFYVLHATYHSIICIFQIALLFYDGLMQLFDFVFVSVPWMHLNV